MKPNSDSPFIAFSGTKRIAAGNAAVLAGKIKKFLEKDKNAHVLIFNSTTSAPVEIDLRASQEAMTKQLRVILGDLDKHDGPGRPKLGVVSREIGLLPRHWEWLSLQPEGASATLRKLVEEAKKKNFQKDQIRLAQEGTYKFMHALAGDFEHYEEALRALYAKNKPLFETLISKWPKDILDHVTTLSEHAFQVETEA